MLYWAYGSNLSYASMRRRGPRAKPHRKLFVTDAALVFRGVADVTKRRGSTVAGGLWEITKECERSLDRYEGAGTFYLKRYLPVKVDGKVRDVLFYQMKASSGIMPPTAAYAETIAEGYRDFGLDLRRLDAAIHQSWEDKDLEDWLIDRHVRKGTPPLAHRRVA